ncbi:MAG TPA: hypothetical protein VGK90_00205, partial [Rhizomicrobium sp.]
MNYVELALLAIAALTNAEMAFADDADTPITYHVQGQTVVTYHPTRAIPLKDYPKVTWIDKAVS